MMEWEMQERGKLRNDDSQESWAETGEENRGRHSIFPRLFRFRNLPYLTLILVLLCLMSLFGSYFKDNIIYRGPSNSIFITYQDCVTSPELAACDSFFPRKRPAPDPSERKFIRTSFGSGYAAVRCYPSIGGEWFTNMVTKVELEFIGLDPTEPEDRSPNQADEDAFCERLQLIGAKYIQEDPNTSDGIASLFSAGELTGHKFCWPRTGGVWVREFLLATDRVNAPKYWGKYKTLVNKVRDAKSMEERCQIFEKMGAKFCASINDCEETRRFAGKKIWQQDWEILTGG